jgi:hypothetical protein
MPSAFIGIIAGASEGKSAIKQAIDQFGMTGPGQEHEGFGQMNTLERCAALALAILTAPIPAEAKGCLKGALAGVSPATLPITP